MRSFRKRLLVLIIGLVIVTQTVTLAAVLASTRRTVEARSWEQLRSGAGIADQLVRFRAGQLANGVAVLAADFGFREAVASGHVPTILSAARNNAQRIGADLVLVLDTHGQVLASTAPGTAAADGSLASLLDGLNGAREQPRFRVFGAHAYQVFLAPVRPRDHRLGVDGFRGGRHPGAEDPRLAIGGCRSSRTLTTAPPASPRPWRRRGAMAARRARLPPPMMVSMSRASTPPST
jgi:hypothetical protein